MLGSGNEDEEDKASGVLFIVEGQDIGSMRDWDWASTASSLDIGNESMSVALSYP